MWPVLGSGQCVNAGRGDKQAHRQARPRTTRGTYLPTLMAAASRETRVRVHSEHNDVCVDVGSRRAYLRGRGAGRAALDGAPGDTQTER